MQQFGEFMKMQQRLACAGLITYSGGFSILSLLGLQFSTTTNIDTLLENKLKLKTRTQNFLKGLKTKLKKKMTCKNGFI